LQAELEEGFDMVFAIGVGKMYSYLARPLLIAKQEGIPTVEIGIEQTDLSEVVDFRVQDPARARPRGDLARLPSARPRQP
jgi:NAD-dependent deacetylase